MSPQEQAARTLLDEWQNSSSELDVIFVGIQNDVEPQTGMRFAGSVQDVSDETLTLACAAEPALSLSVNLPSVDFEAVQKLPKSGVPGDRPTYQRFLTLGLGAGGSLFLGEVTG